MKKLRILLKILCGLFALFSVGMLQVTNYASAEVAKADINTVENDLYSTSPIHVQRKLLQYDTLLINPSEDNRIHHKDERKPRFDTQGNRNRNYGEPKGQICDLILTCSVKGTKNADVQVPVVQVPVVQESVVQVPDVKESVVKESVVQEYDVQEYDADDDLYPLHLARADNLAVESLFTRSTGSRSIGTDATAIVLTAAVVQVLMK